MANTTEQLTTQYTSMSTAAMVQNSTVYNVTGNISQKLKENIEYHHIFSIYLMWPLVIVGAVTNILIIIVMRHKIFRSLPVSVYFTALAITDTIVLIMNGLNQSLKETNGIRLFSVPKLCGIVSFCINFAGGASSWIIVLLALERVLAVGFPVKAKILASKSKSLLATIVIVVSLFIINSLDLWMVDYSARKCIYLSQFEHFYRVGKGIVSLVLYSMIPFGIITVCYAVLVGLIINKNKMKTQLVGTQQSTSAEKKSERLTAMSLYICLAFLVFTGPSHVYVLIARRNSWVFNPPESARAGETFVLFFKQLNYATNFIIYLISNKQFRTGVLEMILRRRATVVPQSTSGGVTGTATTM